MRHSNHLQRNWIFYVICLSFGILHIIIKQDPPLWLSFIELAIAGIIELFIKQSVINKYGSDAVKFGIYK